MHVVRSVGFRSVLVSGISTLYIYAPIRTHPLSLRCTRNLPIPTGTGGCGCGCGYGHPVPFSGGKIISNIDENRRMKLNGWIYLYRQSLHQSDVEAVVVGIRSELCLLKLFSRGLKSQRPAEGSHFHVQIKLSNVLWNSCKYLCCWDH